MDRIKTKQQLEQIAQVSLWRTMDERDPPTKKRAFCELHSGGKRLGMTEIKNKYSKYVIWSAYMLY